MKVTATDEVFRISVTDTGPGIAAADQQKIFEEFSQAEAAPNSKIGGTGLGLAISKRIIELQGGSIGVKSKPGKGVHVLVHTADQGPRARGGGMTKRIWSWRTMRTTGECCATS